MNPHDLKIDGKPITPTTHAHQWYDIEYWTYDCALTDEEIFERNVGPVRWDMLSGYKNVCFEHFGILETKYKYIFPIIIHNTNFFRRQQEHGFKFVDKRIIEHVKNGKAKIVFIYPYEGFANLPGFDDLSILNHWCIDEGLTKDQVYYIHGDFNAPKDVNYTYIPINSFQCWVPYPREKASVFNPINNKNLFLSYTRRSHDHRLLFTCEIINNDLLNRGIISYYGGKQKNSIERVKNLNRPDLTASAKILDNIRPIVLDMDLDQNNPANNIVHEHYDRTFLSVILETHFNNETIFFSEKIWKPISVGQPFMVVTGMNFLRELRNLGYKTFDKWFDESYDTMPDLNDRISCIVSELDRFSKLSVEELKNIRNEMQDVIIFNKEKFKYDYAEKLAGQHNECTYIELKKIWDSF
jgi:hypothetical protein